MKHILQKHLDATGVPDHIKRLHSSQGFRKGNTKLMEESNRIKYQFLQNAKLCLEYDRKLIISRVEVCSKLYQYILNSLVNFCGLAYYYTDYIIFLSHNIIILF